MVSEDEEGLIKNEGATVATIFSLLYIYGKKSLSLKDK